MNRGKTLILGTGMVGKHAVEAATKLGNVERNNDHIEQKGSRGHRLVHRQEFNIPDKKTMASLFPQIDVLVDATQRRDPSVSIVPQPFDILIT